VLKVSHNLHASTLPLLVAARHGERTLAQGLKRQHDFLERIGVDVETISFGGGAGGSRADYTTPRATVQLLRYMATRPDFAGYHDALPSLGIDGTLSKSVGENSAARGKAFAKTGTLYWHNTMNSRMLLTSKALAGYLTTSHNRELAFAYFVNNVHLRDGVDAKSIGRDLGRLCEIVYEQQ
jgi:D-alanyl-D-alanine carboxypeptidase/D-alanyl-D-alanine-endopeptidase (penicillin-binding protein 4)